MRTQGRGRHPLFENLVYVLAAFLALIVCYYSFRKIFARPDVSLVSGERQKDPSNLVENRGFAASGTESAVNSLPPIRVAKTGRLRSRRLDVPIPK